MVELLSQAVDQEVDWRYKYVLGESGADDSDEKVCGIDFDPEILGISSVGEEGSGFKGWGQQKGQIPRIAVCRRDNGLGTNEQMLIRGRGKTNVLG